MSAARPVLKRGCRGRGETKIKGKHKNRKKYSGGQEIGGEMPIEERNKGKEQKKQKRNTESSFSWSKKEKEKRMSQKELEEKEQRKQKT